MPAHRSSSSGLREIHRQLDQRRKLATAAQGRVFKKSSSASPSLPPPRRSSVMIPPVSSPTATNTTRDGVAGKCSARPPLPVPHRPELMPRAEAKVRKIVYMDFGDAPKRCTARPRVDQPLRDALAVKIPAVPNRGIAKNLQSASPPSSCQHAPTATVKLPSPISYSKNMPSASIPRRSSSILVKKGMPVKVRTLLSILPSGERLVFSLNAVAVSDVQDGHLEVLYNGNYPPDDPSRAVRVAVNEVKAIALTQ